MSAPPVCHLAVVACGNRLSETLVLLKSAVLLTRAKIFFHIFADDDLLPRFKQAVSEGLSSSLGPKPSILSSWSHWPRGPVDLKSYWPPKKSTGPQLFFKRRKSE